MIATPRTLTDRADASADAQALRTERAIALLRFFVLSVVVIVYLSSDGVRVASGSAAIVLLILAGVYAFVCLIVSTTDEGSSAAIRWTTVVIDVGLVSLWIQAAGGGTNEFWTLYLIVIVATALRFGILETIAVSIAVAVLHTAVLLSSEGLWATRLYRPTLLVAAGFAVGILAYQRAEQRRRRFEVEALAESTARELGQERAEVARLRKVDLARTEFVGVAAHELRTPLAGILGVLGTLKEHGRTLDDAIRVDLIEGAEAQAERLSRLVEDLLTISRIEDGVLRLSMVPLDPRELVSDAARASRTSERVRIEVGTPEPVVCDADAMIRVLTNLLDNARKYSPGDAPIVVGLSREDGRMRFAVRDAGPGIPEEDREAIFERFRRADAAGRAGAGLGLYICLGLIEAHGGQLEVGRSPEGGAEFSFWLPVRAPGERDVGVASASHDRRLGDDDVTQFTANAGTVL